MGPSHPRKQYPDLWFNSYQGIAILENENRTISNPLSFCSLTSCTDEETLIAWDPIKLRVPIQDHGDIQELCNKFATIQITSRRSPASQSSFKTPLRYVLDGLDDSDNSDVKQVGNNGVVLQDEPSVEAYDSFPTESEDTDANDSSMDIEVSALATAWDHSLTLTFDAMSLDDEARDMSFGPDAGVPEERNRPNLTKADAFGLGSDASRSVAMIEQVATTPNYLTNLITRMSPNSLSHRLRPSQLPYDCSRRPLNRMESSDRFIPCDIPPGLSRDVLRIRNHFSFMRSSRSRHGLGPTRDPFSTSVRNRSSSGPITTLRYQRPARAGLTMTGQVLNARHDLPNNSGRQVSAGAVWNVGGPAAVTNTGGAVLDGRGGMLGSGTNAPLHVSSFLDTSKPKDEVELYGRRIALALEIDLHDRIFRIPSIAQPCLQRNFTVERKPRSLSEAEWIRPFMNGSQIRWQDNEWTRNGSPYLLEAPNLRDDFYCSVLAYSYSAQCLAVGLADKVYLWTERSGVKGLPRGLEQGQRRPAYITSVAFSSTQGGNGVLAIGRADGRVALYSPMDKDPRYLWISLPTAAAHVSFRPSTVRRPSQRCSSLSSDNEVLLVGDDTGTVSIYFVEWPKELDRHTFGWDCGVSLHVRVNVHTQQVCGIAWSPDGDLFATGGNDNLCCLFNAKQILNSRLNSDANGIGVSEAGVENFPIGSETGNALLLKRESVKYLWRLNAAVKAIAFCPWQRGLLAAGGGSNDRCIHFYHTVSGACLAQIDCAAQITSLIWSMTRREIVATFGFAQPEHPFRIAVYTWPSCQQVVAIPWHDEMRALYAIGYPGGPTTSHGGRGGRQRWSRTAEEGCIVVAGSDGSIKFHEIWSETRSATGPHQGLLGGSDILESLHGFDKEGWESIR